MFVSENMYINGQFFGVLAGSGPRPRTKRVKIGCTLSADIIILMSYIIIFYIIIKLLIMENNPSQNQIRNSNGQLSILLIKHWEKVFSLKNMKKVLIKGTSLLHTLTIVKQCTLLMDIITTLALVRTFFSSQAHKAHKLGGNYPVC